MRRGRSSASIDDPHSSSITAWGSWPDCRTASSSRCPSGASMFPRDPEIAPLPAMSSHALAPVSCASDCLTRGPHVDVARVPSEAGIKGEQTLPTGPTMHGNPCPTPSRALPIFCKSLTISHALLPLRSLPFACDWRRASPSFGSRSRSYQPNSPYKISPNPRGGAAVGMPVVTSWGRATLGLQRTSHHGIEGWPAVSRLPRGRAAPYALSRPWVRPILRGGHLPVHPVPAEQFDVRA